MARVLDIRIIQLLAAEVSAMVRFLIAAALSVAAGCALDDREAVPPAAQRPDSASVASAAENPHAGHDMSAGEGAAAGAATKDEHADQGGAAGQDHQWHTTTSSVATDPHAAHAAPAQRATAATGDPHAGHAAPAQRATATTADTHAGHAAPSTAVADPYAAHAQPADSAHALLMELARRLVEDPVVQRRIQADTGLRALWADDSVKRHILGSQR